MKDIHEKDKASIDEVKNGLADLLRAEEHPSLREKIHVLVELVYAKGRLRGYQEAVEVGAKALGIADTDRSGSAA